MTAEQATTLKTTLESMFEHIAQKQSLVEDLQQIEHLHQEIGAAVPTQLRHYLQRRSVYQSTRFSEGWCCVCFRLTLFEFRIIPNTILQAPWTRLKRD